MSPRKLAFIMTVLAIAPFTMASAQTTAFKTGEEVTGMTKQCFYDGLGSTYTRTFRSIDLCPLSIKVEASPARRVSPAATPEAPAPPAPRPATTTAFKTGERTTGMTKQCFYDALGSVYTTTIGSVELCPLSIRVRLP